MKKKLFKRKQKKKEEKAKDSGQQAQPAEEKWLGPEEQGPEPEAIIMPNNDDVPPEKVNLSDVHVELEMATIQSKQSSVTGLL